MWWSSLVWDLKQVLQFSACELAKRDGRRRTMHLYYLILLIYMIDNWWMMVLDHGEWWLVHVGTIQECWVSKILPSMLNLHRDSGNQSNVRVIIKAESRNHTRARTHTHTQLKSIKYYWLNDLILRIWSYIISYQHVLLRQHPHLLETAESGHTIDGSADTVNNQSCKGYEQVGNVWKMIKSMVETGKKINSGSVMLISGNKLHGFEGKNGTWTARVDVAHDVPWFGTPPRSCLAEVSPWTCQIAPLWRSWGGLWVELPRPNSMNQQGWRVADTIGKNRCVQGFFVNRCFTCLRFLFLGFQTMMVANHPAHYIYREPDADCFGLKTNDLPRHYPF